MIELRAVGHAEIRTANATVTPSQVVAFAAGLYLVVERGKRTSRTRLSALLWPGADADARAHRLRQTVYQLKTLGFPIDADRDSVSIAREDVRTDHDELSAENISAERIRNGFEFLPGYSPRFSHEFDAWLEATRDRVHATLTRALLTRLQLARTTAAWQEVEDVANACLRLDPYNEAAVLARAEAFAMRGQKAAAVDILDRYSAELGRDRSNLILPMSVLRRRILQNDSFAISSTVAREPDFVGRRNEITSLTDLVGRSRRGSGGSCLITGEAGIGKTRLANEAAKFAQLQGMRVEVVRCKRSDRQQPLAAFVSLVPRLRELPGALGCSETSLTWLRRLTEFDPSSPEHASTQTDSVTLHNQIQAAVFDLLDAVSEEACLLVLVEDIQWLDTASIKLLEAVCDWATGRKLFLLFTSRDSGSPFLELKAARRLNVIKLSPLAESEATQLIETVFDSSPQPDPAKIRWLITTGEGNPFFLQELVKHWLESGDVPDIPPSIATVLEERLARLTPVALHLLQACVVLGEHSNLSRLEEVFAYQSQDLLSGLQELSDAGMLRPEGTESPQANIAVRHDLLSIEVLKRIAPSALAFLHRRCGTVLEREALGSTISISVMRACAFHWYHAGDAARAYDLAIKCADHLMEIGLAAEAAAGFEGALIFASSLQNQRDVLSRIINAHRLAGNRPAILDGLSRLRALQEAPGDNHHDDMEILELDTLRSTSVELSSLLNRVLKCVHNTDLNAGHRVKAANVALKLSTFRPDLAADIRGAFLAVEPLLSDQSVDNRSRLQTQVIYHTMYGDLEKAVSFAQERVQYERSQGNMTFVVNAMSDLAYVLTTVGGLREIDAVLTEAYSLALEHKLFVQAREVAERFGCFLEDQYLPDSRTWLSRATPVDPSAKAVPINFSYNADATRIALRENRVRDARKLIDEGFDWDWLADRHCWLAAALGLRIRLQMAEQAPVAAVKSDTHRLLALYRTIAQLGRQDYEIDGLVRGLLYVGESSVARSCLEHYLNEARRDLAPVERELARIAAELGVDQNRRPAAYSPRRRRSPAPSSP